MYCKQKISCFVFSNSCFLLFLTLGNNHLFFLSLIDILTVVLAFSIFILSLLTFEYVETDFYIIFGITYLVLGCLIVLHFITSDHIALVSLEKLPMFQSIGNYALILQGISYLFAPTFLKRRKNIYTIYILYFLLLILGSCFVLYPSLIPKIKINSVSHIVFEIVLYLIFISAGLNIYFKRNLFKKNVLILISASLGVNILYMTVFLFFNTIICPLYPNFYNIMMHLSRLVSYFLILRMIVFSGVQNPIKDLIERAKTKDENYRNIFNAMSESLSINEIVLNSNGDFEGYKIVSTNNSFETILNSNKNILENQEMCKHVANLGSIWIENVKNMYTQKKSYKFELFNQVIDKTFLVSVFPMDNLLFGALFQDISENNKLEEIKSDFIHTTTHELRTPLMSLKESFNMLMGSWNISKTHLQSHLQDICRRNIIRLSELVNQVLDYERLDCVKTKQDTLININILISSIVDEFNLIAKSKNIKIKTSLQNDIPMVFINTEDISCLLNNIISNAIKYTDKGHVIISSNHDNEYLMIKVADSGCGIPEDKIDKIFEPFTRISDKSKKNKVVGSGLGLSIAQKIIKKFDGKIFVNSEVGKGSIFTIKIPNKRIF